MVTYNIREHRRKFAGAGLIPKGYFTADVLDRTMEAIAALDNEEFLLVYGRNVVELTLVELGERLGMSKSLVDQHLNVAYHKIRQYVFRDHLPDVLRELDETCPTARR